jgi:translin
MIDKKFFTTLKKEYAAYTQGRGEIIVRSRDILKFSKEAIFACHRDQLCQAEKSLLQAEKVIHELFKKMKSNTALQNEGSFFAALEEYAEAKIFYVYLQTGKVNVISAFEIPFDVYIGALSDFTGELIRKAIALATHRDVKAVEGIQEVIEDIVEQFITFDLMSNLRNKYDAARKNLRKIEEIRYDLAMTDRK